MKVSELELLLKWVLEAQKARQQLFSDQMIEGFGGKRAALASVIRTNLTMLEQQITEALRRATPE